MLPPLPCSCSVNPVLNVLARGKAEVRKKLRNPLRLDPTKTTTIRRKAETMMKARFNTLKRELVRLIVEEDAFGLRGDDPFVFNAFCATGPGGGIDNTCSPGEGGGGGDLSVGDRVSWTFMGKTTTGWKVKSIREDGRVIITKGTQEKVATPENLSTGKQPSAPKVEVSKTETPKVEGLTVPSHPSDEPLVKPGERWIDEKRVFGKATQDMPQSKAVSKAQETLDNNGGINMNIPVRDLIPTQHRGIDAQKALDIAKDYDPGKAEMTVVLYKGKPYIYDGHHTGAAAIIAKEETIRARVVVVNSSPLGDLVVNIGRWATQTDPQKIKAFRQWLRTQVSQKVLAGGDDLWEKFAEEAWRKGATRGFDDTKAPRKALLAGDGESLKTFEGTKQQFLKSAFGKPVAVEKLKLLASRTYNDLEGITDQMSTVMTRTLTQGLARGASPRDIARDLSNQVEGLGTNRALTLARTEIVRAHSEGQLDIMEELGVTKVGVQVEWITAGDDRVCGMCAPLERVVLKIDEARDMLPRHPNCRCAWIPANVGEDDENQKKSKRDIQSAVRASVRAAKTEEEKEWDPGEISSSRPVRNEALEVLGVYLAKQE